MLYTYHIVQSPKGFIDFEPEGNTEWLQWLYAHGYNKIGVTQSDLNFHELEQGIARAFFHRINLP